MQRGEQIIKRKEKETGRERGRVTEREENPSSPLHLIDKIEGDAGTRGVWFESLEFFQGDQGNSFLYNEIDSKMKVLALVLQFRFPAVHLFPRL